LPPERAERRLAAILAADVAGYSRLMGVDEEGTLARLRALRRELIDPRLAEHKGRIVKTTGDGMLVEFASVVDALRCAAEVQNAIAECNAAAPEPDRIELRIGIHQGDIIVEGDDIFGDGVNVAARLEALAEPGGICVSARVQEDTAGRLDLHFENMGDQSLKNIARPVRVYRVSLSRDAGEGGHRGVSDGVGEGIPLKLPDRPSIAVLPFQNMSGDPEQEYFADGMVEEITTAIARFPWLLVIDRNSAFAYKGRAADVKQVARELGVRYVLEGSVRKSGDRVRITGQLIDTATLAHIWADRFDGALGDVFELQDQVTIGVVCAIEPKLRLAEMDRAYRKPTASLDAYDLYLRALAQGSKRTKDGLAESVRLARRAIELDPSYSPAMARLALSLSMQRIRGWIPSSGREVDEGMRMARQAIAVAGDDQWTLIYAGLGLANLNRDYDAALAAIDRAVALNPNFALALAFRALVLSYHHDRADEAVRSAERALDLTPLDPSMFPARMAMLIAHFAAGRYEAALPWSERVRHENGGLPAFRFALSLCGHLGRHTEASECLRELREIMPEPTVAALTRGLSLSPEIVARLAEGWRKVGVPEESPSS
jgi:TolB-like protein/class 3 adenylate cyclase